jgi:putative intracellular protease/amidase
VGPVPDDVAPEPDDVGPVLDDVAPEPDDVGPVLDDVAPEPDDVGPALDDVAPEPDDVGPVLDDIAPEPDDTTDPDTTGGDATGGGDPEPKGPTILMFVAYEGVWWAEYKVMFEALTALGWAVDVRSSSEGVAFSYQSDGTIESSANTAAGSSYGAFVSQFAASFGVAWNSGWNAAGVIPLDGRLQDVVNLDDYDAIVAVGGIGARQYRLDGTYAAVGTGPHVSSASDVQAASVAFARLTLEALYSGKPVLAECHGAPLAAFVRAPGTAGPNTLGTSILAGRTATGYPLNDGDTASAYAQLGVTYLSQRPLVIDGPLAPSLGGTLSGRSRILTTRDWYPQTVSHAAMTLRNAIRSYPTPTSAEAPKLVLVIHGGPVNLAACSASNKTTNDVPCNYGTSPAEVIPADVLDVRSLLEADSPNDSYDLVVDDLDLMAADPGLDLYDEAAIRTLLAAYDAVLYYKHWGTGMTNELELALLDYADDGGGLVAIHHGLYNDAGAKNLLAFEGFEASSEPATWGARPPSSGPFALLAVSHGHFVTSQGVDFAVAPVQSAGGVPLPAYVPNPIAAGYPAIWIVDEIYTNTVYTAPQQVGEAPGELTPLLSNNAATWPAQTATAGFCRRYDPAGDGTVGRLVYLQPGERKANYLATSPYGQIIRNAVVWSATPD